MGGSPLTGKKIAPEPPRRHCSIRNSRTLSGEGVPSGAAAQAHQQAAQQQQGQHMFYGHTAQHWQQQQQQAGAGTGQQPIYANYATIQQTTAEIHCEKYHDSKSTSSIDNSSLANGDAYYCTGSNHECCSGNDVVLIKVGTWFSTVKKRSSPLALNFLSAL